MYLKNEDFPAAASTPWDLIVVGAGAVGLILASSLTLGKRRVLLLESGTREPAGADELNEVMVTGRAHDGALHGRGRTIGGTTTLWGGQLTRFVPYDFERREFSAGCEWPIGFEVVEKYYAVVAGMLGLDARYLDDDSVRLALKAKPFDDRSACEVFFTRWLREPNLARVFAAELESRESLAVAPGCHATQVLSEPGGRITGVKAVDRLGAAHRFDANRVVLACGTIEISRLLLLSGQKDRHLEWAKNPNIGRYFQDHVDLVIGRIESRNRRAFSDIFENALLDGHKYMPKIKMRAAILRDSGALNIAGTARFDSSLSEDVALLKTFIKSLMRGAKSNIRGKRFDGWGRWGGFGFH